MSSSGSSGRVRGAEKHEIYAVAFGGHLFYDLFSQGRGGGHGPLGPPLDPLLLRHYDKNNRSGLKSNEDYPVSTRKIQFQMNLFSFYVYEGSYFN